MKNVYLECQKEFLKALSEQKPIKGYCDDTNYYITADGYIIYIMTI